MDYHFAICDDEPDAIASLTIPIRNWAHASGHQVQLDSFSSAEEFWFHYQDQKTYEVLFLDIELGNMNGVELAKQVRTENKEIQIVFVTGYLDYIADGYDVEALHYLMKPVSGAKLSTVLQRAVEKLHRNERALLLEHKGEMIRIPFYAITHLEVRQNYVTVYGSSADPSKPIMYTVKKPLAELEAELDDSFFRTGRSFLVNLRFIRKITKSEILLKNGVVIPLPRGMYEPLNRAMIRYF